MKGKKPNTKLCFYSILMLLALAWLTVSLPFVHESQQIGKQISFHDDNPSPVEDSTNPLTNTTEEKTEAGSNLLSEYLTDMHVIEHHFTTVTSYYKCHPSDLYFAFHPELLSPPPEA